MGMAVTLSVANSLFGLYSQNEALIEQGKANQKQARNYITSMNFSFQKLEQQRHDAFEATVEELEKVKLQSNRLESQVTAAINEGLSGGGRTADLLRRSAQADTNRATAQIKSNYGKQSNEIDLNKETALNQAKMQIGSIQEVKKPSFLGTMLNIATAYYTGKTNEFQTQLMRKQAGLDAKTGSDGYEMTQTVATPSASSDYMNTTDWNKYLGNPTKAKYDFSYHNPYDAVQKTYF